MVNGHCAIIVWWSATVRVETWIKYRLAFAVTKAAAGIESHRRLLEMVLKMLLEDGEDLDFGSAFIDHFQRVIAGAAGADEAGRVSGVY